VGFKKGCRFAAAKNGNVFRETFIKILFWGDILKGFKFFKIKNQIIVVGVKKGFYICTR